MNSISSNLNIMIKASEKASKILIEPKNGNNTRKSKQRLSI